MRLASAKIVFLLAAVIAASLLSLHAVNAHGVTMTYEVQSTVTIHAIFDGGEPMADAQVTIYGPASLTEVQQTGRTDEEGFFTFTPDPEQPGTWTVQVRQAGHGESIDIELGEEGSVNTLSSSSVSTPQTILMGASIIWGLVGTALFFSRSNNGNMQSSDDKQGSKAD